MQIVKMANSVNAEKNTSQFNGTLSLKCLS